MEYNVPAVVQQAVLNGVQRLKKQELQDSVASHLYLTDGQTPFGSVEVCSGKHAQGPLLLWYVPGPRKHFKMSFLLSW